MVSFNKHIEQISAKVRVRLHEISKIAHLLPFPVLNRTVEALCLTKLYYGMEIYNVSAEISVKIQRIMNVALRLVCNGDMRTRVADMLNRTKWLNVKNKTSLIRIMMLRKILLTRCSILTWSMIQRGNTHEYKTRDGRLKLSWNPMSAFARDGVFFWTVTLWNELKLSTWEILSRSKFKDKLPIILMRKNGNGNL